MCASRDSNGTAAAAVGSSQLLGAIVDAGPVSPPVVRVAVEVQYNVAGPVANLLPCEGP